MRTPEVNPGQRLLPSPEEVRAAAVRIAPAIRATPFYKSETLSAFLGGDVWLKLESEQNTGSFKLRGATNALGMLTDAERARGVVTASAGNHGLGIASAAKALGVRLTVYVPRTAPSVKRDRIAGFGATVDATAGCGAPGEASGANYDDAEALARAHADRTGAVFVSAYASMPILAGQGTVAVIDRKSTRLNSSH